MEISEILDKTIPYTDISMFNILVAIIVLVVGLLVVKILISIFQRGLKKSKLPELVIEFLGRFIGAILKIIVILFVASSLGFDTSAAIISISAILGLILAFGMQESLNNLFAGIWITALKPINKDEYVTIQGHTGHVSAVGMMATELLTKNYIFITIPNGLVWGQPIINFSRMPIRRVDIQISIAYGSSIDKAYRVAIDVMKKHPLVIDEPKPNVVLLELGDSAINLQLRPWTKTEDYWTIDDEILQYTIEAFAKEGIKIPFPQRDIHIIENK